MTSVTTRPTAQADDRHRVVIVGGGITGLAAALRLATTGTRFLLLEAEGRLGGKIATERTGGFVIEGGPDCFLTAKPAALALCRSLGITDRLRETDPAYRRTYVQRGGRLHALPEGLTGLVPSRLAPLLTLRVLSPLGRLRAGCEVMIPARHDGVEESIAQFTTRRFGREAYDWLVEPLLSGIYAGDGARLSLASTFPQLMELERAHRSIVRSLMRRKVGRRTIPAGFVTPAGGLGEIVETITRRLPPDAVRRGVAVRAVERAERGYRVRLADGGAVAADAVILAVPAFASADMLRALDAELAGELEGVPFVSTATVSLAYPKSALTRSFDGYGYVSPRAEGSPIVACTWTSNKFPDRVPPSAVLIRFFIGRAGQEGALAHSDATLIDLARGELRRLFGVTTAPTVARVFRWPRGMPQYVVGHGARLGRLGHLCGRHPGLLLAGASYHGVGIPDCIASGQATAELAARAAIALKESSV